MFLQTNTTRISCLLVWFGYWVLRHANQSRDRWCQNIGWLVFMAYQPLYRSRGRPEVSLFNSYYTEVYGMALLLSLDCSTLPLIHTLCCWVLSKEVSSTIFKVFGMTRPGTEPRSPGPLANTLPTWPISQFL